MRTHLSAPLVIVLLSAWAVAVGVSAQQETRGTVISAHSDLVVLPVTVVDRSGRLVSGLQQANFQVYENDVLQPVTLFTPDDVPVTAGLVIDNSGSMRTKRDDVIAAGMAFARASNPSDELFTVNFNEHIWTGLPPGVRFTDNYNQLRIALSTMKPVGLTALYDATIAALDQLEAGTKTGKVLIIISDGGDNASHDSLAAVVDRAQRANVVIYAVGLIGDDNQESDAGVLKQLAKLTGGVAFFPDRAGDVTQAFESIALEIRSGYMLGYVSPEEPRDGSFRHVRVTVASPDRRPLVARTRIGYVSER